VEESTLGKFSEKGELFSEWIECYDICYTQRDIDNDIIFCLSRDNTVY